MTRGRRIVELMGKLEEHPGTEAYRRLDALGWSVYTFDANTRELLNILDYLTQNPGSWELQALRRRDQLERAEREVVRRLHNMVAAAFSLVEHTRVLRKHMHDEAGGPLYRDPATDEPIQRRIEREFADDPETKFLQDLRRFTQHRELPALIFEMSQRVPDEPVQRRILLSASQLLTWGDWSEPSKRFLEQAGDKINLRELVIRYEERVRRFYYDFETHYRELYQEILEERRALEWEMVLLKIQDAVVSHPQLLPDGTPVAREEAFASILSSSEFAEIEGVGDGPPRADALLHVLERHGSVPEEVRNAIRDFYAEWREPRERGRAGAVPATGSPLMAFEREEATGLLVPSTQGRGEIQPPALGPARTIRDSRVRISELVDDSIGDYLDRFTFERCEIVGPAVVVPIDTEFEQCTWESFGPEPRDQFWELSEERRAVIGALALRECRFLHCNFSRIGIAGTSDYLSGWQVTQRFPPAT